MKHSGHGVRVRSDSPPGMKEDCGRAMVLIGLQRGEKGASQGKERRIMHKQKDASLP